MSASATQGGHKKRRHGTAYGHYDAAETDRKHTTTTYVAENKTLRQSVTHCYSICTIYTPEGIDDKVLLSSCTTKLSNSYTAVHSVNLPAYTRTLLSFS